MTEKVPQLKDATPKLIEETKSSVTTYVTGWTDYFASFSLSQVVLKVADGGLDVVERVLETVGTAEESVVISKVKGFHSSANTLRISGVRKAGTERAHQLEEASIIEAVMTVLGLTELLAVPRFNLVPLWRNKFTLWLGYEGDSGHHE